MQKDISLALAIVAATIIVYLLPGILATTRKHQNRAAIWALNILLGWTLIGWVAALVWSLTATRPVVTVEVPVTAIASQKKCPVCAELIQTEAIKCRYCGANQPDQRQSQTSTERASPSGDGEFGYCPKCHKVRHSSIDRCVYCGSTDPVT